jgi:hypothetical protein
MQTLAERPALLEGIRNMIDKAQARMARVSLVDQLPLNRVAAHFLKGPPPETEPAVLTRDWRTG